MSPQNLQSNGARTSAAARPEGEAKRQAVAEWSWAEALDRVAKYERIAGDLLARLVTS